MTDETLTENTQASDTNVADTSAVNTSAPVNIDYNFKTMEGVEETPEITAIFNSVKNSLQNTGLPNDKAQALIDGLFQTLADMEDKESKVADARFEEGKNALIRDWGDKYETNLNKCNDVILKADGGKRNGDFEQAIRESGINRDPRFVRGLMAIASRFSEDSFVVNNGENLNKDSIQDEIHALMMKPEYINENAFGHKELVSKVWALRQKLG